MAYILEVHKAMVHGSERCQQLARQNGKLQRLPDALGLNDALKLASAHINRDGSVPPTSINACPACN